MDETDMDVRVFSGKVTSEMFGTVDRTVLASGASETDRKAAESTTAVGLDVRIDDTLDMLEEAEYFSVIFKKLDHCTIPSCELLVCLITSRIMDAAAIEDIAASVA